MRPESGDAVSDDANDEHNNPDQNRRLGKKGPGEPSQSDEQHGTKELDRPVLVVRGPPLKAAVRIINPSHDAIANSCSSFQIRREPTGYLPDFDSTSDSDIREHSHGLQSFWGLNVRLSRGAL